MESLGTLSRTEFKGTAASFISYLWIWAGARFRFVSNQLRLFIENVSFSLFMFPGVQALRIIFLLQNNQ